MKYKCLVLDHDDTAVKSTSKLHYPAFRLILERFRPGHREVSLQEFISKNFDPGILEYYTGELGFSPEELEEEQKMWKDYIKDKTPDFFEGFLDLIKRFKEEGGIICVASHSMDEEILRHYKENGIEPDMIFGRRYPEHQMKPNPYPVERAMEEYSLKHEEILVVDDLRFGYEMAAKAGVKFAGVGWAHEGVPDVEKYMREFSDYYFETVEELSRHIFE